MKRKSRWKGTEEEKAYMRAYYQKNKDRIKPIKRFWWSNVGKYMEMTPKKMWAIYRKSAKSRNHEFCLSLDEFEKITKSSCIYCGGMSGVRNGIDRINNSVGYKLENCAPCCIVCNRMKMDHTLDFFIERCTKIANNSEFIKKAVNSIT